MSATPTVTRHHMCLNLRGTLRNFNPREWLGVVTDDDGRVFTPDQVREHFFDEIQKGHVVIPLGKPCEGFDYSGRGCPGHQIEEGC